MYINESGEGLGTEGGFFLLGSDGEGDGLSA